MISYHITVPWQEKKKKVIVTSWNTETIHIFFFFFKISCIVVLTGLFEQRVDQYLEELPDTEQSGVNKFLKGLGEFCSRHTRLDSDSRS